VRDLNRRANELKTQIPFSEFFLQWNEFSFSRPWIIMQLIHKRWAESHSVCPFLSFIFSRWHNCNFSTLWPVPLSYNLYIKGQPTLIFFPFVFISFTLLKCMSLWKVLLMHTKTYDRRTCSGIWQHCLSI
jgi:hypothetical protein